MHNNCCVVNNITFLLSGQRIKLELRHNTVLVTITVAKCKICQLCNIKADVTDVFFSFYQQQNAIASPNLAVVQLAMQSQTPTSARTVRE